MSAFPPLVMNPPDLSLNDLLIPAAEYAGLDLLAEWRWLVPAGYALHWVGVFGDSFLTAPDGTVHFLDFLEGDLIPFAPNVETLTAFMHCPDSQRQCLSSEWVTLARQNGLLRQPGQCYGWKVAPIVGGSFASTNLQLFTLRDCFSATGQALREISQSPPDYQVAGIATQP